MILPMIDRILRIGSKKRRNLAKTININEIFRKIADFFKRLPETIKNAPVDEKAAYGSVGLGVVLLITGIVLIALA